MRDAIPYPLDYQLTLGRILRERLAALSSAHERDEAADTRRALERLRHSDFGTCAACGRVIPYFELLSDPSAQRCRGC